MDIYGPRGRRSLSNYAPAILSRFFARAVARFPLPPPAGVLSRNKLHCESWSLMRRDGLLVNGCERVRCYGIILRFFFLFLRGMFRRATEIIIKVIHSKRKFVYRNLIYVQMDKIIFGLLQCGEDIFFFYIYIVRVICNFFFFILFSQS